MVDKNISLYNIVSQNKMLNDPLNQWTLNYKKSIIGFTYNENENKVSFEINQVMNGVLIIAKIIMLIQALVIKNLMEIDWNLILYGLGLGLLLIFDIAIKLLKIIKKLSNQKYYPLFQIVIIIMIFFELRVMGTINNDKDNSQQSTNNLNSDFNEKIYIEFSMIIIEIFSIIGLLLLRGWLEKSFFLFISIEYLLVRVLVRNNSDFTFLNVITIQLLVLGSIKCFYELDKHKKVNFYDQILQYKKLKGWKNIMDQSLPDAIIVVSLQENTANDLQIDFINNFSQKQFKLMDVINLSNNFQQFQCLFFNFSILKVLESIEIEDNEEYEEREKVKAYNSLSNSPPDEIFVQGLEKTYLVQSIKHLLQTVENSNQLEENDDQQEGKIFLNTFFDEKQFLSLLNLNDESNIDQRGDNNKDAKYFDIRINEIIWGSHQSVILILSKVQNHVRLSRIREIENYQNRILQTVSHNLKTPLNCMMMNLAWDEFHSQNKKSGVQDSNKKKVSDFQEFKEYQQDEKFEMLNNMEVIKEEKVKNSLRSISGFYQDQSLEIVSKTKISQKRLPESSEDLFESGYKGINENNNIINELPNHQVMTSSIFSLNQNGFSQNFMHNSGLATPFNPYYMQREIDQLKDIAENQARKMDISHKCGRLLQSMINDLIDYSTLVKGDINLKREQFNLRDLVQEINDIMMLQTNKENVKLFTQYLIPEEDSEEIIIYNDQRRLQQILFNLLGNSLQFTYNGYVKIIIERDLTVQQSPKNSGYENILYIIKVQDTGIGIEERKKRHIFNIQGTFANNNDKFLRQTKINSRQLSDNMDINNQMGSSGMGLAISKHLVEHIGPQTLFFESEKNKGSSFWFKIYAHNLEEKVVQKEVLISQGEYIVKSKNSSMNFGQKAFSKMSSQDLDSSQSNALKYSIQQNLDKKELSHKSSIDEIKEKQSQKDKGVSFKIIQENQKLSYPQLNFQISMQERSPLSGDYSSPQQQQLASPVKISQGFLKQPQISRKILSPPSQFDLEMKSNSKSKPKQNDQSQQQNENSVLISFFSEKRKILIVDDTLFNILGLKELLTPIIPHISFEEAYNGQQAIDIVFKDFENNNSLFDLVFMDLSMPVMDGLEATRIIKQKLGFRIPIIILSAYNDNDTINLAMRKGADGYINKPGSVEAIQDILIKIQRQKEKQNTFITYQTT